MYVDAVVQQTAPDEWMALSREPAVVGEILVVEVGPADAGMSDLRQQVPVYVTETEPVIFDDDVRHKIRLRSGDMSAALFGRQQGWLDS